MKLNDAQYISELEKKIAQLEARANKWIGIAHNIADRNGELEESLREEKSEVAQLEANQERYQRLLYWALMQKDGQDVPWNGEFRFDHEQGLAWFFSKAELEALGGE